METAGQWLEKALNDLCSKIETGLVLDADVISGLVSYCDLASPIDAQEYLNPENYEEGAYVLDLGTKSARERNIIGEEAGKSVIHEYLKRRGYSVSGSSSSNASTSKLQAYVKPSNEDYISTSKKPSKPAKEVTATSVNHENHPQKNHAEPKNSQKENQPNNPKKKKSGKVISLAEAARGSIVFKQGKPCSCQARRHNLVSNCLSCGKIVCEQEGEGPCQFCGALVLREGSTYAGLSEGVIPLSQDEVVAEAYAKRLVEYDRNSAARTTVIDDQSDYYEIEGNTWLSMEEKELLRKKREKIEEAERDKRNKVVMTFDLVGRKVLVNTGDAPELESENSILRAPDEREENRIKPNPTVKVQPIFIDPGPSGRANKGKHVKKGPSNGLCLKISGRVQHEGNPLPVS